MTTQRTSRALAREAAGLCMTATGAFGVLAALGALHWAAGVAAAMGGLLAAALRLRPQPDAPRSTHRLRWAAFAIGYSGLTAIIFALCAPVGWIVISLTVAAAGWWLATGQASEGA